MIKIHTIRIITEEYDDINDLPAEKHSTPWIITFRLGLPILKPIQAVVVGAGHRAMIYSSYAESHPDLLQIVGVADLNEHRRRVVAERFGIPSNRCFESADSLASVPRFADAVINGTMDHQHVPTALPLLEAGYDMLLEKPFAVREDELWTLVEAVSRHKRKVAICHELRYAPFCTSIKREILAGTVGEIINVQTVEHVSYHHMAVGFVGANGAIEADPTHRCSWPSVVTISILLCG